MVHRCEQHNCVLTSKSLQRLFKEDRETTYERIEKVDHFDQRLKNYSQRIELVSSWLAPDQ